MEYKTNKLITLNSSFKHINELNPGGVSVLPHKQWELVRRIGHKYGIGVTDLTPALIEESDNLLHEGLVFSLCVIYTFPIIPRPFSSQINSPSNL